MKKEKEAHHCQQQAFRPVPQENLSFVEQASCVSNRLSGLFHKKIYLLWNRPESLFLKT
ncbi:hypothetical protein [Microcoleus sp. D3_18a_C4]|uniref:hypothetical protein n=1 Tax=unclassified Microcoleus TaxID=2642155 RepID=UPI002FD58C6B